MTIIVFVTVPTNKAKALAEVLLKKRVCACVNIIKGIESMFWWEGKIDQACESLLIIKTKKSYFSKLKKVVTDNHPYTVPEIIACNISQINKAYCEWLYKEVNG